MSSLEGLDAQGVRQEASCRCLTEQGTTYELSQPECRTLARNGPVYNPYRERPEERSTQRMDRPDDRAAAQPAGMAGSVIQKQTRALGTFPESAPYENGSVLPPTTRDL